MTERTLLDQYLVSKGLSVDDDMRAAHYEKWDAVMNSRISGNLDRMASAARVPSTPAAELNAQGYDAHEARYRQQALGLLRAKHPSLDRLGMERWTFDATTLSELLRIMTRLQLPMPGDTPHVLFALPPSAEVDRMQTAWAPAARPTVIQHGDPERLMQGYRGKTLIVIGHITGERKDTLTASSGDGAEVSFSLAELTELARKHNVLFVPIGCESAQSAAVGFTKEITSVEVTRFLHKLQGQRQTVGDVVSAMNEIGEVQVNGAKTESMLQVVVRAAQAERNAEAAAKLSKEEIAGTLVSLAEMADLGGSDTAAGAASALAKELDELAEDARPWYDRGPLRWLREAYREHPWSTLFVCASICICAGFGTTQIGHRLNEPAAKLRPLPYQVALGLFAFGAGLLLWSAAFAAVESVMAGLAYVASLGWVTYRVKEPTMRLLADAKVT